jgi:hypothetical protein
LWIGWIGSLQHIHKIFPKALIVSSGIGPHVQICIVLDAEEKSHKRVKALQEALKDHKEMAVRFQSITDGAGSLLRFAAVDCRCRILSTFSEGRTLEIVLAGVMERAVWALSSVSHLPKTRTWL